MCSKLFVVSGGKQTTLSFKPVKKEKADKEKGEKKKDKRKKGYDSSDDGSDKEIDFDSISPPPRTREPRRAAKGIKASLNLVLPLILFNLLHSCLSIRFRMIFHVDSILRLL